MIDVYVFGLNSLSKILAKYLEHDDRYRLLGFTVNEEYFDVREYIRYPVGAVEDISGNGNCYGLFNGVGYSGQLGARQTTSLWIQEKKIPQLTYIHPNAVTEGAVIGDGSIILPGVIIEPYSRVGNGNVFYGNCCICHDGEIGDYNWFSAGCVLAGHVRVGQRNFVGINAAVRERISIGSRSTVGAGAVVINDISDGTTVVGNPACPLNRNSTEN